MLLLAMKRYALGISGASGTRIGVRLLEVLLQMDYEIHLVISRAGLAIMEHETSLTLTGKGSDGAERTLRERFGPERIFYYPEDQLFAPVASGSFQCEGMFVAPCSMKTLSAIANGYASNLLERAADVTIKEGRKLILCPREMPFSAIHLENMLKLARLGVVIAPPAAAFYQEPESVDQMVDFFVGKLLDSAGIPHSLFKRWGV